jgi:hypothetical protein
MCYLFHIQAIKKNIKIHQQTSKETGLEMNIEKHKWVNKTQIVNVQWSNATTCNNILKIFHSLNVYEQQ